jgi:uncharacterized protein YdhG (YjbR/CyaY superfamily)
MASSKATTVAEYLEQLPDDRRKALQKVRSAIKKHLPKGYKENTGWGGITYEIPLKDFPNTYNGQPLCYAALTAKKNYNTLHLMVPYGDPKQRKQLEDAFAKAGKKLDMGKACIHFKTADDLPLPAIGKLIAAVPPAKYIQAYQQSRKRK